MDYLSESIIRFYVLRRQALLETKAHIKFMREVCALMKKSITEGCTDFEYSKRLRAIYKGKDQELEVSFSVLLQTYDYCKREHLRSVKAKETQIVYRNKALNNDKVRVSASSLPMSIG
ncbi:hypothetical protein [Vibrio barjaei]|uniref:hypothetical protein n=1 Tax=Vibrio barjaei TaxID=1676683 RepID=UPI0022833A2C|nr:hypothetical protein [Vibrio barjaei]MCY9874508.1 hypothetical protein [Vibrio barjaei]